MTYEHYIKNPMEMVELKLNMIISENPLLIISLDRDIQHPLIRKNSIIPFDNQ